MEANDFINRVKADSIEQYKYNLLKVLEDYRIMLNKLPAQNRGMFGLNVLRTLCWNIDKAPIWRDNIDNAALLTLAIDCIRETRQMDKDDRLKTLACIYHVHKYAVQLNKSVPPELVLKISVMPFELDSKYLLKEYNKTYWHLLADRLTYIERLKTKVNITKLLPKLTADIIKIIDIYDTVQFCSTVLVFLLKKLHMLYSATEANKLVQPFRQIFSTLCQKRDIYKLKELPETEIFDIYKKLNDCLYVVADNSSKMHFKDGILDDITQKCVLLVGHRKDLSYCIQTFYLSLFCKIISQDTDMAQIETVFENLQVTFLNANKQGYNKALQATYPYLSQLLRFYIEYEVTNGKTFTTKIQESCLKLILFFMKKLKECNQLLKCENCPKKTGLHDAFRLSLSVRHLTQNVQNETVLDTFYLITTEQYAILAKLGKMGCSNYQKLFRKLQTDVHNTAISLNKSKLYEISIKLFDIYLKNELKCTDIDHKNISRALFNKSICELDSKLYEKALINSFLSLTFARQEGLKTDKHMSLVMDIKARELKSKCNDDEGEETDDLQLVTVLDACKMALNRNMYEDLMPVLSELKFSAFLQHEFSMYAKLWPAVVPVGGVWRALHSLARGDHEHWAKAENEAAISDVLYDVILETPSVVRTIHTPYFSNIVGGLLEDFDNMAILTPDEKLVQASLLFLQCEYDLAAAGQKHKWKHTDPSTNPDNILATRTIPQEHAATRRAIVAVRLLRDLLPLLQQVSKRRLVSALRIFQIFVPLLQQLCRDVEALQLSNYCCHIADIVEDRESYLSNAGVLLTSPRPSAALAGVLDRAARGGRGAGEEAEIAFLCDAAVYYKAQGKPGVAARLVQAARARIEDAGETSPELNLDLAVGRVLEAQYLLYGDSAAGPCALAAVNGVLRHYSGLSVTGGNWSERRLRSLSVRVRMSRSVARACSVARALALHPRARAVAAAALPLEAAPAQARLHADIVDVTSFHHAQIKIDQHLKYILGLDPSNETQLSCASDTQKQTLFTPRQELETMRDNIMYRTNQTSPSDILNSVPAFKIPDFFHHDVKCTCYACEIPVCGLLACKTSSIEAAMYAFANENEIARNYFKGVMKMIEIASDKLKKLKKAYMDIHDDFIVKSVMDSYDLELKTIEIRLLIDAAFFELKNNDFDAADDRVVDINDIVQENNDLDQYLKDDVLNLMAASAKLKKATKKPELVLEEFEIMQISPSKENIEQPSTPVSKPYKPPKLATKKIVKKEELPQKRTLKKLDSIKLDLDDDECEFEKPKTLTRGAKKDKFKIPNPIIPKPAFEEATPRSTRSKPHILVTEASVDMATPARSKRENVEFFTPVESTPEQFFTPMTSVKTYTKRPLRHHIVKNLEQEFMYPGSSTDKENRNESSIKANSVVKGERSSIVKEILIVKEVKTKTKEKLTLKEVKSTVKEEKLIVIEQDENSNASSVKDTTVNAAGRSRGRKEEKRTLIRTVSPGKMNKEGEKTTRTRHH